MRYVIKVNADVWTRQAPEQGIRAILMHELAHVQQLSRGMRVRRLGLVKRRTRERPDRFQYWRRRVPLSLADIEGAP